MPLEYLSDCVELLAYRKHRLKLNRVSVHADVLNDRHTKGNLAEVVSMRQFMEADYFLYLRQGLAWRPWSTIFMDWQVPRYLAEAIRVKGAQQLLRPLRVDNVEALRKLIVERNAALRQLFPDSVWFQPLEDFKVSSIGSI